MGKDQSEPNSLPKALSVTVIDDAEKVAPYQCPKCGHWLMVPLEPGKNKCERCGYCVECV